MGDLIDSLHNQFSVVLRVLAENTDDLHSCTWIEHSIKYYSLT